MAAPTVPDGLTEAEIALFGLVATLERDDYRNPSGVLATTTSAFIDAKTLVCLFGLLGHPPGSRHRDEGALGRGGAGRLPRPPGGAHG
jgi:hypothetical protein